MRLASLRGGRDGRLVLVDRDHTRALEVAELAPTLQAALDDWRRCAPALRERQAALDAGRPDRTLPFDPAACAAPLPRAYQWADGSAYLSHVERVRKARGAELPPDAGSEPLMYQGGSDCLLGPCDPIEVALESFGIDFEAEVAVITDDVPMGVGPQAARRHVRLLVLVNDVSLRALVPGELAKGFGFFQSKPASAFAPLALTPDELGPAWDGARLHLPLRVFLNDEPFGAPDAGADTAFDFGQLIAHAARTRRLGAGSIIGAGTASNRDASKGFCCIAERRCVETVELGAPQRPFLRFGDRVRIEMRDPGGRNLFGSIAQSVTRYLPPEE